MQADWRFGFSTLFSGAWGLLQSFRHNPAVNQWRSRVLLASTDWGNSDASSSGTSRAASNSIGASAAGNYLNTYYYQTLGFTPEPYRPLSSSVQADVCVIGGGLAGLATAMSLVERGRSVVLLEGSRVGGSASGLNGGFAVAGFSVDPDQLIEMIGDDAAAELYRASIDAQCLLRHRLERHRIECDRRDTGSLTVSMFPSRESGYRSEAAYLNRRFGTVFEVWPASRVRRLYRSARYHHAMFDPNTFTVNPLAMCLGLARACSQLGVCIHEHTWATRIERLPAPTHTLSPTSASVNVVDPTSVTALPVTDLTTVHVLVRPSPVSSSTSSRCEVVEPARWRVFVTRGLLPPPSPLWTYLPWPLLQLLPWPSGVRGALEHRPGAVVAPSFWPLGSSLDTNPWLKSRNAAVVLAHDVVLCGGPSLPPLLDPQVSNASVTARTFIGVTEPLGEERLRSAVAADYAVCDDRFALNYFRPLPDTRLLWGGFIQTYPSSERSLHESLRRDLASVFPQLRDVRFDFVWGGPLAYAAHMMPLIGRTELGLYYASGFGGHGVVPTTLAGELLAGAIVDPRDDRYQRLFQRHFPLGYAGHPLGSATVQLTYWWYQLRDSLDLTRASWTRRDRADDGGEKSN